MALDDRNRTAVARICVALDGLPLALELAAARTAVLDVEEIAARLDRRMRLLRATAGGEARHMTLEAAIDWSHDLLSDDEKRLFAVVGCFDGGFDREALVSVSGLDDFDVVDLLTGLVGKSLVESADSSSGHRFRLLETVREYAAARLAASPEASTVTRRHAEYFASLVQRARIHQRTPDARIWTVRLAAELANLRRAFGYWLVHDPATAAEMPLSMWPVWTGHMLVEEGGRWLTDARDALDPDHPLTAQVIDDLASMDWTRGGSAAAEDAAVAAIARAREQGLPPRPTLLVRLAAIRVAARRSAEAVELLDEALDLYRQGYEPTDKVEMLSAIGSCYALCGRAQLGAELCDEGVSIARNMGPGTLVSSLNNASLGLSMVDPAQACTLARESLEIARSIASRYGEGNALFSLGVAERMRRQPQLASRALVDGLRPLLDSGQRGRFRSSIDMLVGLLRSASPEGAIVLGAASARLQAQLVPSGPDVIATARVALLNRCPTRLTHESFDEAWRRGMAISFDDIATVAAELIDEAEVFAAV